MRIADLNVGGNVSREATTLHILSNFAVGSTAMNTYWQEQIASLQRDALPFQTDKTSAVPSLILDAKAHSQMLALFDMTNAELDIWSTWCTFVTIDRSMSDSFLLVSASSTSNVGDSHTFQKYQLIFRFEHSQHFHLLEAMERAGKVVVCASAMRKALVVPFYDPELSLHLDYIRPLFC